MHTESVLNLQGASSSWCSWTRPHPPAAVACLPAPPAGLEPQLRLAGAPQVGAGRGRTHDGRHCNVSEHAVLLCALRCAGAHALLAGRLNPGQQLPLHPLPPLWGLVQPVLLYVSELPCFDLLAWCFVQAASHPKPPSRSECFSRRLVPAARSSALQTDLKSTPEIAASMHTFFCKQQWWAFDRRRSLAAAEPGTGGASHVD
jgi:hypothetical protein